MKVVNKTRLFGVLALAAPALGGCAARSAPPAAPAAPLMTALPAQAYTDMHAARAGGAAGTPGWTLPQGWAVPQAWPVPQGWGVPQAWPVPVPLGWPAPQAWPLPWPGTQPQPQPQPPSKPGAPSQPKAPQGPRPVPAVSVGAPAAIAYARSRLGTPYCWGGSGPGCYDCSGLTSQSWKAGGRAIPRTSEAQAEQLPEVPLDAIVPGDILWRPGHVALYVGGGQVIHAPRTGDVVRYAPATKFVKAVRP